nr:helix-turn-helix transcriptional regulator [Plantibacter sp. CFBP 8798]
MLCEFRELVGLSRSEAAGQLQMSAEYLRLIELGRRTPAMGQMNLFMSVYGINGELGKLQHDGNKPDLIFFPPLSDEPMTVDFASRIREARRPSRQRTRHALSKAEAGQFHSDQISDSRAQAIAAIVALIRDVDNSTLANALEVLRRAPLE